jgi:hypothetical protein
VPGSCTASTSPEYSVRSGPTKSNWKVAMRQVSARG